MWMREEVAGVGRSVGGGGLRGRPVEYCGVCCKRAVGLELWSLRGVIQASSFSLGSASCGEAVYNLCAELVIDYLPILVVMRSTETRSTSIQILGRVRIPFEITVIKLLFFGELSC